MNLLTIENICKSYTDKILLDHVSFGIQSDDKIGVIGLNGTGKSTLLKIIAGIEEPDDGSLIKNKNLRLSYLPQTPYFDESMSILNNVLLNQKAENEYRNLEGEARAMLKKLNISEPDSLPSLLSGGQKKRAALVKTLLTPSDLLILDEPTNHLDNEMTEWLEEYLRKYNGAFIMVTHDRFFLDKITNKILEIDKGCIYSYTANYSQFVSLKAEREEIMLASERKNKSLYKTELEWMMRGARARSTKQKAHIKRFEELRDRNKIVGDNSVEITSLSKRLGKKTIIVNSISMSNNAFTSQPMSNDNRAPQIKVYSDKNLFKNFSYIFLTGDRIGIIGPNGCGKSTLLKIICGYLEPEIGSIDIGETVNIGYFSQENEYMPDGIKVIDYLRETAEYVDTSEGRVSVTQLCEKFLFSGTLQYTIIGKLSGGEKRRLYLLKILINSPNVLILDEPTNDLDIQTLTILEDYLTTYPGIVIAVSHDRYFLDKITERIFAFEDGLINQYEGNYSDYREKSPYIISDPANNNSDTLKEKVYNKAKNNKIKFTYNEEQEYKTIDKDIERLEESISAAEEQIALNAANYSKLTELIVEKEALEKELEVKMERWVYLNELAEKISSQKG